MTYDKILCCVQCTYHKWSFSVCFVICRCRRRVCRSKNGKPQMENIRCWWSFSKCRFPYPPLKSQIFKEFPLGDFNKGQHSCDTLDTTYCGWRNTNSGGKSLPDNIIFNIFASGTGNQTSWVVHQRRTFSPLLKFYGAKITMFQHFHGSNT